MEQTDQEIRMRRYLLGGLLPEGREDLEDRYLSDGDVYDELLAIEDDLIDAYVRGELAGDDRQDFETRYLSTPERIQKVEFARALNHAAAMHRRETRQPSVWQRIWASLSVTQGIPRWSLAVAMVLVSVSVALLIVQQRRSATVLQQSQAAQVELRHKEDRLRRRNTDLEQANTRKDLQTPQVAQLEVPVETETLLRLSSGDSRSAEDTEPVLTLQEAAAPVGLMLELSDETYKNYVAALRDPHRRVVIRATSLPRQTVDKIDVVVWLIPAHLMPPGDYTVQLRGLNPKGNSEYAGEYTFRVSHK